MRLRRPPAGWLAVLPAAEAMVLLIVAQTALCYCRLRTVRRLLQGLVKVGRTRRRVEQSTILWALGAAKRRCLMTTTCLGEALAAEALLRQHGYDPRLCIGAARREGRFEAHAWLEDGNTILIGGPEEIVQRYTRFPENASLSL